MPLTLTLRTATTIPLEVAGLLPASVRELSLPQIEQWQVFHGNRRVPLAEFFTIAGSVSDDTIVWQGELTAMHGLGMNMTGGTMRIEGSVGRWVGAGMSGGEIHISGDVSDEVGCEMRGGVIHVRGNAGNRAGGAFAGSLRGMSGGTLLISGNAGHEVGHTMRRGLIAIGGSAGDHIGHDMRAGTILIGGNAGKRHGSGMRRGTIAFLSTPPTLLPSFRHACRYRPPYLPLLAATLKRHNFPIPAAALASNFDLHCGDVLEGGRGEILCSHHAPP